MTWHVADPVGTGRVAVVVAGDALGGAGGVVTTAEAGAAAACCRWLTYTPASVSATARATDSHSAVQLGGGLRGFSVIAASSHSSLSSGEGVSFAGLASPPGGTELPVARLAPHPAGQPAHVPPGDWSRGGSSANLGRPDLPPSYAHYAHIVNDGLDQEVMSMAHSVSQPGSLATLPPARLSYRGIADDIAARIAGGEYPAGAQLPSTAQLAQLYSVNRSTIVRAVGLLHDRGLVEGVAGVGVFVRA